MPQLRVGLAQVNPVVGDLAGNAAQIVEWTGKAAASAAHVVVFPEMMLTGYPVEDLALRRSFQVASRQAAHSVAAQLASAGLSDIVVVFGHLDYLDAAQDRLGRPFGAPVNAASVAYQGNLVATYRKHHLPNYGVFDEFRYFVPGNDPCAIRVCGIDIALAICEDLWQDGGPVARVAAQQPGLLLVLNGSPFEPAKDDARLALVSRRAAEAGCPIAYVNMVGGQDELVFDGDSLVVGADGELLARAPAFDEGLMSVDLDLRGAGATAELADGSPVTVISQWPNQPYRPHPLSIAQPLSDTAAAYGALVVGLRDYVRKNGFKSVVLGLSGGIDSALVATIAVDALGPQQVHGVSMPSVHSSEHSRTDAADLASRLGIGFSTVPIAEPVASFESQLKLTGVAAENLQARVRGVTLMAISNQAGHLVLATGNKSELAVGYSTIYGDAVGGFAPIKDVPKTLVWELARWRNGVAQRAGLPEPIPVSSIEKPPSAELRPGQLDTDSLPDYNLLDQLLAAYVDNDLGRAALIELGFEASLVDRVLGLVDRAEYKRRQYPPGTKISSRAFGRDRRLPITNRWLER